MDKKSARLRRARRGRLTVKRLNIARVCVHRTPRHIYAQLIAASGDIVVASASTLDADVKKAIKYSGNVEAAEHVGKLLAERALAAGIKKVAFDRSGFKYHGRVKALAEAAREGGLDF